MKRHWKFYGSDGNGGFIEGVTTGKYSSMKDALVEEIYKRVHNCLRCEAV
jgi:hypothetical protein